MMPEVMSPGGEDLDLCVAPRDSYVNSANYVGDAVSNPRPTRRSKDYYGDAWRAQILLVPQIFVGRNEDLKSFFLGGI